MPLAGHAAGKTQARCCWLVISISGQHGTAPSAEHVQALVSGEERPHRRIYAIHEGEECAEMPSRRCPACCLGLLVR